MSIDNPGNNTSSFSYLAYPLRYTNDALLLSREMGSDQAFWTKLHDQASFYEKVVDNIKLLGVALSSYLAGTLLVPVTFALTPFSFTADMIKGALHYYKIRSNPEELEKLKTDLKGSFETHTIFVATILETVFIWAVMSFALGFFSSLSYPLFRRSLIILSTMYAVNWPAAFGRIFINNPKLMGEEAFPYIQFLPEMFLRYWFERLGNNINWDDIKAKCFEQAKSCLSSFSQKEFSMEVVESCCKLENEGALKEWQKAQGLTLEYFSFSDLHTPEGSDSFTAFMESGGASSENFSNEMVQFLVNPKCARFSNLLTNADPNLNKKEISLKHLLFQQKMVFLYSTFTKLLIEIRRDVVIKKKASGINLETAKEDVAIFEKIKKDERFYRALVNCSESQIEQLASDFLIPEINKLAMSNSMKETDLSSILERLVQTVYWSRFFVFANEQSEDVKNILEFFSKSRNFERAFYAYLEEKDELQIDQIVEDLADAIVKKDVGSLLGYINALPKEEELVSSGDDFASLAERLNRENVDDEELSKMLLQTPLEIFGFTENPTKDGLETAYRKKALELHPDKNQSDPWATQKYQLLGAARASLSLDFTPSEEIYKAHFRDIVAGVFKEVPISPQQEDTRSESIPVKSPQDSSEDVDEVD